jgi:predicted type IV restriction endonuclease
MPAWCYRRAMPAGFNAAFAKVKQLVADFRANEKFYLSPAYQEQEARRDFIDKFWLALGWDVNHETQKNPFEQEVKVERKEHDYWLFSREAVAGKTNAQIYANEKNWFQN